MTSRRWLKFIMALSSLFVSNFSGASAKAAKLKSVAKTSEHRSIKSAASFQFCFEIPHGRCFNTTATGWLRQAGGKTPSQALVAPADMQSIEAEIAGFVKATIAAAPRKPKPCQQTLAYRSFDTETFQMKFEAQRCLEFLNKSDTAALSKLVAKLSLATKPR